MLFGLRRSMDSERRHYELRSGSRSRSRTPLVQNCALNESESTEHRYNLRGHSPERSCTPGEVTSSRKSGARSLPTSATKTHDGDVESITEGQEETTIEAQTRKSEGGGTVSVKKMERRSERQRAKRQIFANGQNEAKDIEEKRTSVTPRRVLTSDYSSEEGEREDPPSRPGSAYEIYKQAGDWWNVFPKTDYTYSEKSQCRYEIAPGVLAMPNMSRRSIHSECGSSTIGSLPSTSRQNLSQSSQTTAESGLGDTSDMGEVRDTRAENLSSVDTSYGSLPKSRVYTKTHVERYKCHREIVYTGGAENSTDLRRRRRSLTSSDTPPTVRSVGSRRYGFSGPIDSDAELEDAVSALSNKNVDSKWKLRKWLSTLTTLFVLCLNKLSELSRFGTIRERELRSTYGYRRYHESKWNNVWRYIDRFSSQYVYLAMVKIFFFDSWLLSRVSNVRRWLHERGPKVLWIALLPLFFLTGYCCLSYSSMPFLIGQTFFARRISDAPLVFSDGGIVGGDELLRSVVERLNDRVDKLMTESNEQTERLSEVTRTLRELKESDSEKLWRNLNNKIVLLEKKLDENKLSNANVHDFNTIKVELEDLKGLYSQLKACCKTHMEFFVNEDLDKRIERVIAEYFGPGITKEDLGGLIKNLIPAGNKEDSAIIRNVSSVDVGEDRVREIVKEVLRIYDADKTGRVDYALESAGGQIISTRCTQRYDIKTRAFKLLAFTLYHENNNPRTVIQGNPIQPGACWAFQGFPGYLLIKLRNYIYVTGFTIEHAPKSILPNAEMRSAPRKFNVWGFIDENDPEPVMFGDYEFVASDENLQYFPVQNTLITTPYEYVELRVHSNHGQLEYTCLYRFRVHGKPI